jgi:hypothetical protein
MSHYIKNVKLAEKFPSHVDSAPTTQATKQDCDMVKKYEIFFVEELDTVEVAYLYRAMDT